MNGDEDDCDYDLKTDTTESERESEGGKTKYETRQASRRWRQSHSARSALQ